MYMKKDGMNKDTDSNKKHLQVTILDTTFFYLWIFSYKQYQFNIFLRAMSTYSRLVNGCLYCL